MAYTDYKFIYGIGPDGLAEAVRAEIASGYQPLGSPVSIDNNPNLMQAMALGTADTSPSESYTLPAATTDTLGGVKVGNNLSIEDGVLSATDTKYTLPAATTDTLGGVKVGNNLSIEDGVLSATDTKYTLPKATTSTIGGVKAATAVANVGSSSATDVATLVTDHNALASKINELIAALVASGAMVAGG